MNESHILLFFIFIIGVSVGSFLNVVIWRYQTGWGIGGRSHCLACGKTLTAKELIPVMSFLFQAGRCRHCSAKISWQYPIVELLGGVLTLLVFYRHIDSIVTLSGFLNFFLDIALWWTLLIIAVYDIKHKIIPNTWVYFLAGIGLTHAALVYFSVLPSWGGNAIFPLMPLWSDLVSGPLVALPFALMWLVSHGRWIGLGDAKLMLGLGWFFGIGQGLSIFIFSFWIGAIPSLLLLALPRSRFTMKSEIPFAPFIILATLLVYISGINILSWTM